MIGTATPTMALDTFTLTVPKADVNFFKTMAKKMGWTIERKRKKLYSAYELSLKDLDEGRVYEYDSLEDFIKEIENDD